MTRTTPDARQANARDRQLPAHLQKLVDLLPLNQQVHRSTIFEAYGNSNYARRIRKIVSEYGWAIERHRGKKGANDDYYIRRSDGPVREQRIRREVAPPVRIVIYERDGYRCRMCHADLSDEQQLTRPQCDHKIPAERGGTSDPENLQTLCLQCNLKKRQACRHCTLKSCAGCPYAFPEAYDLVTLVALSADVSKRVRARAEREGIPPAHLIMRILESSFSTR